MVDHQDAEAARQAPSYDLTRVAGDDGRHLWFTRVSVPGEPIPIPVPVGVFERAPEGLEVLTAESVPLPDWLTIDTRFTGPPEWIVADRVRRQLMDTEAYRRFIREREVLP